MFTVTRAKIKISNISLSYLLSLPLPLECKSHERKDSVCVSFFVTQPQFQDSRDLINIHKIDKWLCANSLTSPKLLSFLIYLLLGVLAGQEVEFRCFWQTIRMYPYNASKTPTCMSWYSWKFWEETVGKKKERRQKGRESLCVQQADLCGYMEVP